LCTQAVSLANVPVMPAATGEFSEHPESAIFSVRPGRRHGSLVHSLLCLQTSRG
jgi:hypothetical protein